MTDDTNSIRAAGVMNARMLYKLLAHGFYASPKPAAPNGLLSCVQIDNGLAVAGTNEKYQHFFVNFEYDGPTMSDDRWEEFLIEPLMRAWVEFHANGALS